jgi:hypothetical protein
VSTTRVLSADQTQSALKNFGRATLADYFGDLVIYRNLEPLEPKLKGRRASAYKMDISLDSIPRKQDRDYAKATVWLANAAQKLRKENSALRELIFMGDTAYNDGQAYTNMRSVSGWEGACYIGADRLSEAPKVEINDDNIYTANRWSALGDWIHWVLEQGLQLDKQTLVVVDIDKTALGAKGRNDEVINEARLEGIYRTMADVLTSGFDRPTFEEQYAELNRSRYHFLTEDNQDYLAYICLVLNAGLIGYDELLQEVEQGNMDNFEQFLRWIDSRMLIRPASGEALRQVHESVMGSVRTGDPTPFKRFRRQEFITTMERMGQLPDDTPVEILLAEEITLTNEICELVAWLKQRGCLLICLSDKPDEASTPDVHTSGDLLPVHKASTHRVGSSLQPLLDELS